MEPRVRQFFGTDGVRGRANQPPLTPHFAVRLAEAAGEVLLADAAGRGTGAVPIAVVGKDTRRSGDMLECAVAAGLAGRGIEVRLAGVIPTPAVAMLTRESGAVIGVVVSASHNPHYDNGIKFFSGNGQKLDDSVEAEIEGQLLRGGEPAEDRPVPARCAPLPDAAPRYIEAVRRSAGDARLLAGLRIALDAANGAAWETSAAVLEGLGAEVLAFHNRPDGENINAGCGCTHPSTIESLVRETGADLGISHDGDADRVLVCDETGSALDGDEFMAIAATAMIEEGTLRNGTLVATVMSNGGLEDALRRAGGRLIRAGVGDRHVAEAMRRHDCNFGGEQSGHFLFLDHGTTGDGILAAVQLLRLARLRGRPLSELRKVLQKRPQAQRQLRVRAKPEIASLAAAARIAEAERALAPEGRLLLRYSGTEPLLRILVEGLDPGAVVAHADALAAAFAEEIGDPGEA